MLCVWCRKCVCVWCMMVSNRLDHDVNTRKRAVCAELESSSSDLNSF